VAALKRAREQGLNIHPKQDIEFQDEDGTWRFESDIDLPILETVKGTRQSEYLALLKSSESDMFLWAC